MWEITPLTDRNGYTGQYRLLIHDNVGTMWTGTMLQILDRLGNMMAAINRSVIPVTDARYIHDGAPPPPRVRSRSFLP